jgi:glycosyltransferase involved in cell wall biosynthesis
MFRYEKRFPESASRWEYLNRERSCRNISRWSKGVLVDSETGKLQMAESYNMELDRIHVLPYIAPKYMRQDNTPADFDSRYQLPAKFIFYPAQFWEHKNHKGLINAVRSLKGSLPDLKLVLSGAKQNAYNSVVKAVQELNLTGDVIFLGYVPDKDMPELYRRSRALVMPTYYGPTNIPPLEAFVAGCPVAVSGIYGMPEQVGDAALLFNPDSVKEIADCIKRLWVDDKLCAQLSERGKRRAANWDQRHFNERLMDIVTEITGEDSSKK